MTKEQRLKWREHHLPIIPVVLCGLVLVLLFVSAAEGDLMITGNTAWQLWNSHFTNFYEVVMAWEDSASANYMPTTYILFGLWILPLKLLGYEAPVTAGTNVLRYVLWYKLLPVLFYAGCAYLIYKIAREMKFGDLKARWCAFAFVTAPVAVYSQFIFSQYDSFTLFFMLLGIYFYLKDKTPGFIIGFAIAASFKYYAILFFAVVLMIREKRIGWIILKMLGAAALDILYLAIFLRSHAFSECIFGFNAMDYIKQSDFSTILGSVSFMQVAVIVICAWSYFVEVTNKTDAFRWAVFLCCGLCFALFGLSTFHPQWLLIAVPFWLFGAMMHRRREVFMWLDMLFGMVFYLFAYMFWANIGDDVCLYNGVWRWLLNGRIFPTHIADLIPYSNSDQLYTVIVALMLIFFVFQHPKYGQKQLSADASDIVKGRFVLYLRAAVGPALYIIPAALCLIIAMNQSPVVVLSEGIGSWHMTSETTQLEQVFKARYDVLDGIDVTLMPDPAESEQQFGNKQGCSDTRVELVDRENGYVLYSEVVSGDRLDGATDIHLDMGGIKLNKGEEYGIRFVSVGNGINDAMVAASTSQADMNTGCYALFGDVQSTYCFRVKFYYQG